MRKRPLLGNMDHRCPGLFRCALAIVSLLAGGCIPSLPVRRPPSSDAAEQGSPALAPSLENYLHGLRVAADGHYGAIYEEPTEVPPAPLLASNPDALELWPLTLAEAIQLALRNNEVLVRSAVGTAPVESGPNLGFGTAGRTIYDPALVETEVERQLARFDARWETALFWNNIDVPFGSVAAQFQGFRRDLFQAQTFLRKPLITGGELALGFTTNYQFRRVVTPLLAGLLNPEYETQLILSLRQPLGGPDAGGRFAAAGVAYNRVPILIARINADQELWQFRENLMIMVRDVEEAYWQLFASQVQYETLLRAVQQSWRYVRDLEEALKVGTARPAELLEARAQLDSLREALLQAKAGTRGAANLPFDGLLVAEARLRGLLGLPPHNGKRIVAVDEPTIAPVVWSWEAIVREAYRYRPQLALHRLNVEEQRQRWIRARGQLRPQIDLGLQFRLNGLGDELDSSLDVLTDHRFSDWQIDLQVTVPLGYRREFADAQAALLQIANAKARLYQAMRETDFTLADLYRDLDLAYQRYRIAQDRLATAEERLRVNLAQWEAAPEQRSIINLRLVQAIEGLRQAQLAEIESRVGYQLALVRLEHAKGTLLAYNNIHFHRGPTGIRIEMEMPAPQSPPATLGIPSDDAPDEDRFDSGTIPVDPTSHDRAAPAGGPNGQLQIMLGQESGLRGSETTADSFWNPKPVTQAIPRYTTDESF